jgi:hypothetical protein
VGGEDDVCVRVPQAVGDDLDERLVVVPALDEHELRPAGERLFESIAIAPDRHT